MNAELVSPAAVLGLLAGSDSGPERAGGGGDPAGLWRGLRARVAEELRYHRALLVLRRLDDRDLDDLDLGRGDLPTLARRHARGVPAAAA